MQSFVKSTQFVGFIYTLSFPHGSVVRNPPANAGDVVSISGLERSSGEGNGNSLQYSCLGNPMDRGAWGATVHGVARVGHDRRDFHLDLHLPWTCTGLSD